MNGINKNGCFTLSNISKGEGAGEGTFSEKRGTATEEQLAASRCKENECGSSNDDRDSAARSSSSKNGYESAARRMAALLAKRATTSHPCIDTIYRIAWVQACLDKLVSLGAIAAEDVAILFHVANLLATRRIFEELTGQVFSTRESSGDGEDE